jgi:acetyltransferase-like isoleucine patch superfamily enzyme
VAVKRLFRINNSEHRDSIFSAAAARAAVLNFLLNLATFVYLPLLHSNYFLVWFYRGMGAKIGKGTVLSTHRLWDCDLIEIGEDCLIGSNSSIAAHYIVGNAGRLRRVRIGSRVTVGANTSVMPGVVIEDDVVVGSNSLVPQGAHLESGGVYLGVPVQRIN